MSTASQTQSLKQIAQTISNDWKTIPQHAKHYLNAMKQLESVNDNYGLDSGKMIVAYFLANASSWRGEVAKQTKAILNKMIK